MVDALTKMIRTSQFLIKETRLSISFYSAYFKHIAKGAMLVYFALGSYQGLADHRLKGGNTARTIASVQGRLWHDYNANGIQDAGEPTISGSKGNVSGGILIFQSNNPFTTINNDPSFSQIILDGFYTVHYDMPFGYDDFSPKDVGGNANDAIDSDVDRTTGTAESFLAVLFHDYDAGVYRNASLGDRVWIDANNNGVQDPGEQNAPDGTEVLLFMDTDNNNFPDGPSIWSTTTSGGNYLFTELIPGNYIVGVKAPAGYENSSVAQSNPNNNSDTDNNGIRFSNGIIYSNSIYLVNTQEPNGSNHDDNYTLDFGLKAPFVSISGNVFNDVNALVAPENTVNGMPITNFVTTPLYANLYEGTTLIGWKQITGGAYVFDNLAPNKTYTVVLSTTQNTRTPSVPVGGWYNTGENIGTAPGSDGIPNGIISVPVVTTNVVNVNFGLQQPPTVISTTLPSQSNPGGTISAPIPDRAFKGTDVNGGVPVKITLTSFPTNATSFAVYPVTELSGGTTYYPNPAVIPASCPTATCTVFPVAGVEVVVDENGNPYSVRRNPDGSETKVPAIHVDPVDGNVSSVFTYTSTDNGGAKSPPATVTVPFSPALPVKLVNFTISSMENLSVQLSWATTWEQNSKIFEVERSVDAKRWIKIGGVDSKSNEGDSDEQLDYNFTDNSPAVGANYYRLKQVDLDGNFEYSQIRTINLGGEIAIYPNPIKDGRIWIKGLRGSEVIRIYSKEGRVVKVLANEGTELNIENLPSGIYMLRVVRKEGGVTSLKFIKE